MRSQEGLIVGRGEGSRGADGWEGCSKGQEDEVPHFFAIIFPEVFIREQAFKPDSLSWTML